MIELVDARGRLISGDDPTGDLRQLLFQISNPPLRDADIVSTVSRSSQSHERNLGRDAPGNAQPIL
jgi:hypothetical protein